MNTSLATLYKSYSYGHCLLVLLFFPGLQAVTNAAGFPQPGAEYQPPSKAPNIPGSTYLQSLTGQVSDNAPVIAAWNESARPGESVTLTGTRFTLLTGSEAGSDTNVWICDGTLNYKLAIVSSSTWYTDDHASPVHQL